jgi:hypothetical protein
MKTITLRSDNVGRFINLKNEKLGRLSVVEVVSRNTKGEYIWKCHCDCGNYVNILGGDLRRGHTTSCGCYRKERQIEANTHHGKSSTRLFLIWESMRKRTTNKNDVSYKNYGGRGITVCPEWQKFMPFYNWAMTHGYEDNLTIDRKNVNGNYEPSNCQWATVKQQSNNRRNNIIITFNGETHNLKQWSEILKVSYKALFHRIKRGWSIEKALSTPVRQNPGRYAWILEDIKPLPEPIPARGAQGLWNWEPEGVIINA